MKTKTIRNIGIFIIVALASGWIGYLIDKSMGPEAGSETPGMGIWLVLPLLTAIILRAFAGDGWKDIGLNPNTKANLKWYLASLLIFPIVTTLILVIGRVFGWISFSSFRTDAYIAGFTAALLPNFIKNIFEEFVWRGYLAAKLLTLRTRDVWLYLIVGGVWGAWHLPYYLFFLTQSDMARVLPVSRIAFALMAAGSMICWTIMFVELYRITKSIWPVVILHMMEDSLTTGLVIDGHIAIASGKEILVSPIVGIVTSFFYVIVGLLLRRYRIFREATR